MRLIDADALVAKIWEEHKKTEDTYDLCVDEVKDILCGIVSLIDEQPTAYNLDKVVEQLDTYITKLVRRNSALYQTVMQIVKGGGADG